MKFHEEFARGISILIPTWNNLPYLKVCIEKLEKYSKYNHQVIVHVNDGSDGTLGWVRDSGLSFSSSEANVGVCHGMNAAYKKATKPIIGYFNDDYMALPEWDVEIFNYAREHDFDYRVLLASVMLEPEGYFTFEGLNYGDTIESYRERELLDHLPGIKDRRKNRVGCIHPPNYFHRELWNKIGGYSPEFSPGNGSDPDLVKKLYDVGVRVFDGVARSVIYHFVSKVIGAPRFRQIQNNGRAIFYEQHGVSLDEFWDSIGHSGEVDK